MCDSIILSVQYLSLLTLFFLPLAILHVHVHADRRIEKEDLTSYIGKKREMFLLQVCQYD